MILKGVKYDFYVLLCREKSFLVICDKYDVILSELGTYLFINLFLLINAKLMQFG